MREWLQGAAQLWGKVIAVDRSEAVSVRLLLIAALGMGAPVAIGLVLHQMQAGFTIGLGAILLAGTPRGNGVGATSPTPSPGQTVAPALIATAAATLIAALPQPDSALILLAALAGILTGYSRPVAEAFIRFIVYLVLSFGFLDGAPAHRRTAALIFGLGALWNIALRGILAVPRSNLVEAGQGTRPAPTRAQRRAYFRRTLHTLEGWQYPLRLASGLAIGSGLRHAWPTHHYYWILLTIALLTQRPIEHVPVKTVQRLTGTIGGVALTAGILIGLSSPVVLGTIVCVFATVVPWARARSYLLYAIVSTPLILLVLDLGKPVAPALLVDRLVATFIGGFVVMALNALFDWLLAVRRGDKVDRSRALQFKERQIGR